MGPMVRMAFGKKMVEETLEGDNGEGVVELFGKAQGEAVSVLVVRVWCCPWVRLAPGPEGGSQSRGLRRAAAGGRLGMGVAANAKGELVQTL